MKKLKYVLFAILLLVAVFFAGPKVDESIEVKTFSIPENVDEYLTKSESQFKDIKPNSEKKIVWFDSAKKNKTQYSIVYLHGYSASRMEVSPLGDRLAKELNANLYYTRLNGHGRSFDAMGEPSVNDWINDAVESLKIGEAIGEKVIIIGTSTGATLASWLGSEYKENSKIAAFVFLSPNFWPKSSSSKIALFPWGKQIVELVIGKYREWDPKTEEVRKYWSYKAPSKAVVTLMGTVDLVSRSNFSKIETPLLIFYSTKDTVINPQIVESKFLEFGSKPKKLIVVDNSEDSDNHILAGNIKSPSTTEKVFQDTIDFLKVLPKQ